MILSQKKLEEIAIAVIRDFQKSFFGSEVDNPARFALPTPIDQFASDYLNLKVSFQKLSSDGSIYGLTAYVDTEYQIEVDGGQRSIFLKTNDVVHQQRKVSDLLWMAFLRHGSGEDRYFLWCLWCFEISSSYPLGTTGLSEPEKGL